MSSPSTLPTLCQTLPIFSYFVDLCHHCQFFQWKNNFLYLPLSTGSHGRDMSYEILMRLLLRAKRRRRRGSPTQKGLHLLNHWHATGTCEGGNEDSRNMSNWKLRGELQFDFWLLCRCNIGVKTSRIFHDRHFMRHFLTDKPDYNFSLAYMGSDLNRIVCELWGGDNGTWGSRTGWIQYPTLPCSEGDSW